MIKLRSDLELLLAHAFVSISPVVVGLNLAKYMEYNRLHNVDENFNILTSSLFGYVAAGVYARLKPYRKN